jgi:hypothetical protein
MQWTLNFSLKEIQYDKCSTTAKRNVLKSSLKIMMVGFVVLWFCGVGGGHWVLGNADRYFPDQSKLLAVTSYASAGCWYPAFNRDSLVFCKKIDQL